MRIPPLSLLGLTLAFAGTETRGEPLNLEHHPGKAIYAKLCVDCHGAHGEGVKDKADDPLQGSRTLDDLAGRIERTMPEDEEHLCVGEDAKAVAAYVYDAFYSVEARARNTPARIDLSRLTVPQYRNSIADLIIAFRGEVNVGEDRGIKGQYFGDRGFNERKEFREQKKPDRYERVDDAIRFDYGEGVPKHEEAKEFTPENFSIRWEGTILPPETGVYEFVVRTRNGATLWVNENNHGEETRGKLIDAWVAPDNNVRDEKGSLFLIGGRPYPLRLEFFTYKEKAASIELLWKTPHGVLETIPKRNLAPFWNHETFVVDTPFPADDRSVGYERGTAVSKAWLDATTAGAINAAGYVTEHLDELAKTKPDQPDRVAKVKEFAGKFVERAFRRPLPDGERKQFVEKHFSGETTPEQAIKRIALLTLTSPRFLYPGIGGPEKPDKWDLASRISLTLWDSLPNQRLLDLVNKGELENPAKFESLVNEMVWNWRTRAKMQGFFHHWLELERADELSKDKDVYPGFDDAIIADLRTSLSLFLDNAVWGKDAGYRQLMLADYLYLNERLGKFYGVDVKGDFQPVKLDPKQRSGIVTHPFLLSSLAYYNNTSPIHRGVFLTRNIVGMPLKSPPMANVFKDGKFDPSLTMREKVTEMTRSQACMGCHITINPLGFSLENYDGTGRWRTKDREKVVDSQSDFKTESGETIRLTGARDVAEFAANTPSAHRTFVEQLFHHFVKQPVRAYGDDEMEVLRTGFENGGFYIPELLKQITLTTFRSENRIPAAVARN
jgi:hypothetical protein